MEENLVLAIFFALPPVFLFALWLFIVREKRRAGMSKPLAVLVTGNLLVLLLLLSLGLLGAECYYRFLYDTTDSFSLTKTSVRWFERYYRYNSAGFRDSAEDYSLKSRDDKKRITFVGDSFTAGHGIKDVNDRFANRFRTQHPEYEVHIYAKNGFDTVDELFLISSLIQKGYDLGVVVLVYNLNDIADVIPEWRHISMRISAARASQGFFVRHSYFFNLLYYHLWVSRDPDIGSYFQFVKNGYQGDTWKKQMDQLVTLKRMVEDYGGRFLVVTFPFLHALGPVYPYRDIHRQLNSFWASLNVPHLDLYDLYAAYRPSALTVNARDAHPNVLAHGLASEAMSAFLMKYSP